MLQFSADRSRVIDAVRVELPAGGADETRGPIVAILKSAPETKEALGEITKFFDLHLAR